MNRKEFISNLRKELSRLPREEVDAAIEYYEEYFDEAGEENEQEVLENLGSCKKVANQIKSEYAVRLFDEEEKPTVKKGISAIWYVIIGICSAPVAIPAAIALGILAITIFIALAGCVLGLFFGILGCFAAAGALVVLGVASIPAALSTGLMFIGTGLAALGFMAGIGVLLFIGVKAGTKFIIRVVRKRNRRKKVEKMLSAGEWKRVDDEGNEQARREPEQEAAAEADSSDAADASDGKDSAAAKNAAKAADAGGEINE